MTVLKTLMVFRRNNRLGNIINSTKNVVENQGNIVATTNSEQQLISVADNYSGASTTETATGSKIFGVFVTIYLYNNADQVAGSLDWYYAVRRGATTFADFPAPNAVGLSNLRNQILHQEKGLAGTISSGAPMVFKGVIRIPRQYQRLREGDIHFISFRSSQAGKFCIRAIYKWYK